jgi:predicted negative regulator of RcsB-dependent stress response
MRKATITLFLAASVAAGGLFAQKPFVMTAANKKQTYDKITDNNGILTAKAGPIVRKLKPSQYKYAWIPLNQAPELAKMVRAYNAKKYAEVASLFKQAYPKYHRLGWQCPIILVTAKALNNLGKKSAAIAKLELVKKMPLNTSEFREYFKAKRLLAELYVQTGKFDKAKSALKDLGKSNDDSIVAFANNIRGDIYLKEGKTKDAVIEYAKTALLFGKNNRKERPQALSKIVELLRKEKNNKSTNFEKMLRSDYPDSPETKNL